VKELLMAEMLRAIDIMSNKEEIKTMTKGAYWTVDRETSELKQLFLAIRKHSIMLEKEFKN
jgi:hypothetical protein